MGAGTPTSQQSGTHLADDGVVGGGDGVEDPFDALQLLLVAGGDPVKRLVVVLQSAAAFAGGNRKSAFITSCESGRAWGGRSLTCPRGRPPPCISSSSALGSPSPPSPPTRSSPPLTSLWASAEPGTGGGAGPGGGARSHGAKPASSQFWLNCSVKRFFQTSEMKAWISLSPKPVCWAQTRPGSDQGQYL